VIRAAGTGSARRVATLLGALLFVMGAVLAPVGDRPGGAVGDSGGYVLDGWGGLHAFGGAPTTRTSSFWPGWDIARGVGFNDTGNGGWVLDGWGGLHPFGGAPVVFGGASFPGRDLARGIGVNDAGPGGWVLDGWGGLHPFGGAPVVFGGASFPGRDLARGIAVNDDGPGGWVLDAYGGLHPFGGAPVVYGGAYFPGWDMARGIAINDDGPGGWVLDGWGGLHRFGGAPVVTGGAFWPGWDIARGVLANAAGPGGWVLDGWGGVHAFSGAPTAFGGAAFPGWDIARSIAGSGGSSGARPARPARTTPILRTLTYSVGVLGAPASNFNEFVAAVEETYADPRGWSAAGLDLVRVPAGGDFTIYLSQASLVPTLGSPCDSFYSCAVGRTAAINDDRFRTGSPYWPGPLAEYRRMVINHETGHLLGFGHFFCPGPGAPAPVMQQQSKGLQGCAINPWPTPGEITIEMNRIRGLATTPTPNPVTYAE
jgi:hypothetical protein